jgi:hypothetical protein
LLLLLSTFVLKPARKFNIKNAQQIYANKIHTFAKEAFPPQPDALEVSFVVSLSIESFSVAASTALTSSVVADSYRKIDQ